ncbi:RING-type E3 ubiquitin transferase [Quillaja saponaria]|uniref:U-box domain-containing protein n=1 Tax=Quillaja saponaria TaxID=32244 RepID=A0AAD7L4V5_QUISA|nr:RING-type E3 ubiquitin transferase [Quillaja saponaria]
MDDCPPDFRCPISMEVMEDPVIIATGVTYERKNIMSWFFLYNKSTCPATMQIVDNMDFITPNHNLKRLIVSWRNKKDSADNHSHNHHSRPSSSLIKRDEMVSILTILESNSPFKVRSMKKLRSILETSNHVDDDAIKSDFIQSNGIEVLVQILVQILDEGCDFNSFTVCEEALGVLQLLPISEGEKTYEFLLKPEAMRSMAIMLQRGSTEARLYTVRILRMIANTGYDWNCFVQDQGVNFFKSLLELVSDEICSKASCCGLDVLIKILGSSKRSRLRAIEAGAVCVLIELLLDSNKLKCEKILLLIKLLCKCAEGRLAMVEHGMGIAMVSKKMLHVSIAATKIGVKILWLICSCHPSQTVLEEMLVYGAVKRMVALLHMEGCAGRSSTKDKVVKMLKLYGNTWKHYPCFPCDFKDCLGLVN